MSGAGLSRDFWKFWTGQTISNLGSSFTFFALPLLVYKLTGSAVNLAITTRIFRAVVATVGKYRGVKSSPTRPARA